MVNFSEAVNLFFKRFVDFSGRSSRSEYWWAQLFIWLVIIGLGIFAGLINGGDFENIFEAGSSALANLIAGLAVLFFIAIIIPNIALAVRRFHDLGQTGWLVLVFAIVGIIPLIGTLTSFVQVIWFCFRGTIGPNRYGYDPLDPNANLGIFD